jgi:hypothetical protein
MESGCALRCAFLSKLLASTMEFVVDEAVTTPIVSLKVTTTARYHLKSL